MAPYISDVVRRSRRADHTHQGKDFDNQHPRPACVADGPYCADLYAPGAHNPTSFQTRTCAEAALLIESLVARTGRWEQAELWVQDGPRTRPLALFDRRRGWCPAQPHAN